ncbi:hypothetical protein L204_101922 [Cryptococcus depauperatus]|nr:U4/U6.U5 tri-snRNP-associated protein 1 [Cryptococcus depauperatus CBS 7855]
MSSHQESLSLEETNKVRVSLGLAPIGAAPAEGEEVPEDKDAIAEENYAKRRQDMKREKEEKEVREKIEKARNKSALNAKLRGTTLADPGKDDNLDAKAWIKKQKKGEKRRAKEFAEMNARELEERNNLIYGEEDLAGIRVGHDVEDFEEGEDVILTLKDSKVLDEGEDELQNVNMTEDAAIKAAKDRKRKAQQAYTGYDDEEFDEGRIGQRAEVLGKYDESFVTGKVKLEGFRLGGPVEKKSKLSVEEAKAGAPVQMVRLNLDYTKEFEVSDYVKEGEAGFKKPKRKKTKRSSRHVDAEEDTNAMGVDDQPTFAPRVVVAGPENLVDDDDLQAALSRARRAAVKKKSKVKQEDFIAQIAQRRQEEELESKEEDSAEDGRITFDETSEFVRNVSLDSLAVLVKRERIFSPPNSSNPAPAPAGPSDSNSEIVVKIERREEGEVDEDEDMGEEDEGLAEIAAREGMSLEEYRIRIDSQMQEIQELKAQVKEEEDASEPTVGQGMAGVLALLRHQGALKSQTTEDEERERIQKQKDLWLADYRRRMAQRELERIQARGGNKDQAQREWENRMREQQEARDALDIYKNYKPDVSIKYHDEFGREMTPKEAWKSLSHKFHGKTSGRMKTEKRLKKIAEERKQLTMNSSDTPLGMSEAFSRRQQKTGEAHMVLTVGNKQSVQANGSKKR